MNNTRSVHQLIVGISARDLNRYPVLCPRRPKVCRGTRRSVAVRLNVSMFFNVFCCSSEGDCNAVRSEKLRRVKPANLSSSVFRFLNVTVGLREAWNLFTAVTTYTTTLKLRDKGGGASTSASLVEACAPP